MQPTQDMAGEEAKLLAVSQIFHTQVQILQRLDVQFPLQKNL
jgi:hypothetical protein